MNGDEWQEKFNELYRATCAFGIGDMNGVYRSQALQLLSEVQGRVRVGLTERDKERAAEADARILKAFREGRLVERQS